MITCASISYAPYNRHVDTEFLTDVVLQAVNALEKKVYCRDILNAIFFSRIFFSLTLYKKFK